MTPDYAKKLQEGLEYQDHVRLVFWKELAIPLMDFVSRKGQFTMGENINGVEIKLDQRFRETGNLFIEIAEKSNPSKPNWIPSGIYRNDNTWLYAIGDYQTIYILSKKQLQVAYQQGRYPEVTTPTSKAFLLPVAKAEGFYAVRVLHSAEENCTANTK